MPETRTELDPHATWKISAPIPIWLKQEIKAEMARRDIKQEELMYEILSERYPVAKRRFERLTPA